MTLTLHAPRAAVVIATDADRLAVAVAALKRIARSDLKGEYLSRDTMRTTATGALVIIGERWDRRASSHTDKTED